MTEQFGPIGGDESQLLHVVHSAAAAIERIAISLYAGIILLFLLAFTGAAHFLTVEADESWMLLSTMHAFAIPVPETTAVASPTLTTGGVHLLLHGILALFTSNIFVHRLISLIFTGFQLGTCFHALKRLGRSTAVALAGTALFAAAPGMIFQASLATAEMLATLLVFWACLHWVQWGQRSNRNAVLSGALFGLSCTTRVNCVVALAAIPAYSLFADRPRRPRVWRSLLTVTTAGLIMGLGVTLYFLAARTGDRYQTAHFLLESTGAPGAKSISLLIWDFVISDRLLPAWLIAAICGAWITSAIQARRCRAELEATQLSAILLLIGLVGLLAWLAKAPIPHVRYLWPAIPCLWFAGIIQLTQPIIVKQRGYAALPFHLFILAACASALAGDALIVANGESLTLVYQAIGTSPLQIPRRSFHAAADQRSLARFVSTRPPDARFYALVPANAFPITFLSHRTIAPVQNMGSAGVRYLVLNPADIHVWHPDAAFVQWMRLSTTYAFVSGEFAAIRVNDGAPLPPSVSMNRVGDSELLSVAPVEKSLRGN